MLKLVSSVCGSRIIWGVVHRDMLFHLDCGVTAEDLDNADYKIVVEDV